jgi:hypothetical protein
MSWKQVCWMAPTGFNASAGNYFGHLWDRLSCVWSVQRTCFDSCSKGINRHRNRAYDETTGTKLKIIIIIIIKWALVELTTKLCLIALLIWQTVSSDIFFLSLSLSFFHRVLSLPTTTTTYHSSLYRVFFHFFAALIYFFLCTSFALCWYAICDSSLGKIRTEMWVILHKLWQRDNNNSNKKNHRKIRMDFGRKIKESLIKRRNMYRQPCKVWKKLDFRSFGCFHCCVWVPRKNVIGLKAFVCYVNTQFSKSNITKPYIYINQMYQGSVRHLNGYCHANLCLWADGHTLLVVVLRDVRRTSRVCFESNV